MAEQNFPDNILYELDNLDVLRGMNSETVDLIATDPPFNTKRNRSGTAGFYVDNWKWGDTGTLPDQWAWNEVHPVWLEQIQDDNPALHTVIEAARVSHGDDIAAFLCFLSVRLLEMHRVLKPTGSIYLHCDHAANAYIRMAMDAIFGNGVNGKPGFRNEITWKRQNSNNAVTSRYGNITDVILFYTKSETATWNQPYYQQRSLMEMKRYKRDNNGRLYKTNDLTAPNPTPNRMFEWRGATPKNGWRYSREKLEEMYSEGKILTAVNGKPRLDGHIQYLDEMPPGGKMQNIWDDIPRIANTSQERTGSPDQKPLALYERIVLASSNEGDLVLDPFAGCATTIMAARKHNRRWVGIDRRKDARYHVVCRMAGVKAKDAEEIRKRSDLAEWLDGQLGKYDAHYSADAPTRTDTGEVAAPVLHPVFPFHASERSVLRHDQMRALLVERFGLQCWGCGFTPPSLRYLHLDHISPKTDGGGDHLDNRALLCQVCNLDKSNTMTLTELRRNKTKEGMLKGPHPIDLAPARSWARQHLERIMLGLPQQMTLGAP